MRNVFWLRITAGFLCGLPSLSTQAQMPPAPPSAPAVADNALPTSVRLAVHGRPGDAYMFDLKTHMTFTQAMQTMGPPPKETREVEKDTKEVIRSLRVRSSDAKGNIVVEERTIHDERTEEKNGRISTFGRPLKAWLTILSPQEKELSRTPLIGNTAAPSKPHGKEKSAPRKPASLASNDTDEEKSIFSHIPLPNKTLHVGDTWEGTFPIPDLVHSTNFAYTAKLIAIEQHMNRPTAHVEYVLKATIDSEIPGMKEPPKGETLTGVTSFTGVITKYYTLDRGVAIDTVTDITFTMRYKEIVNDPNSGQSRELDLAGDGATGGQEAATAMPVYDASLVSKVTTSP